MNFNRKILILLAVTLFIFISGAYSAYNQQNINDVQDMIDDPDLMGCCSILLQVDDGHTLFAYRRDSNVTADITIEKVNWHGKDAIKQYKTEDGYFCHVIVTSDGWFVGLGGIDDGIDNEKCENITAKMITEDGAISNSSLEEIQKIKQPYGRGHVLIKSPNGTYGFATVDKIKTGTVEQGRYISIPNNYSYSRADDISLETPDKVKLMNELAQSDKYGLDRREIITYDFKEGQLINTTDIYVSNEDGSELGIDYTGCIDDVYFNNTLTKADDIPIAPNYKNIGSVDFIDQDSNQYKLIILAVIVVFVIIVVTVSYASYWFVRFIKSKIRR